MKYRTYNQKDYAWVKLTESEIRKYPKEAYKIIEKRVGIIKKIKSEDRTYVNTILAYEECNQEESKKISQISTLSMCSDDEKIRKVCNDAVVEYSNLMSNISYDIELYKAIMDYYNNSYILEKDKKINKLNSLDLQDIKLIEDIVKNYKRMGFDKDTKTRNKRIYLHLSNERLLHTGGRLRHRKHFGINHIETISQLHQRSSIRSL